MFGQTLNRQMKVDTLRESEKVNPEADKAYVIVHSQIPNLHFDSNRNIDKVNSLSSGDWEVWLPFGTHRLKIYAEGFQGLELQPFNFARKRSYEMIISAVGFASQNRADENLIEITFQCNQDSIYSSYNEFTPMLSFSKFISYKLPKGEYTFRFQKRGYETSTQKIDVSSPKNLDISLTPGLSSSSFLITLPGIVVITSDPSNAEIVINGQKIGNTPYQGELAAGNYQLELRKTLYYTDASSFSIDKGKTQSLNIKLKPKFGYLSVSSSVPESKVYFDDKLLGNAPIKKMQIESIPHNVKIEAELYHSKIEEFKIADGEEKIINADLNPAFGSIEITSTPESGAEVFIDGINVGKTPFLNNKLASGKYLLKVTKEFYNDFEEQVIIGDLVKYSKNIVLNNNYGELTVNAPDCNILLNEKIVGKGNYHAKLSPGKYTFKAERNEFYRPAEEDVFLKIGDNKTIDLQPSAKLGSLSVFVEPVEAVNAEIYIDNEFKGNAPVVFPLLMGNHNITAKLENYLPCSETVNIVENNQSSIKLNMLTFAGSKQQTINHWATTKWISLGATALAGGAFAYFKISANKNYTYYTNSGSTAEALQFRNKVTKNDNISQIALYTLSATAATALITWIIQISL
jgi:hypothetical protein